MGTYQDYIDAAKAAKAAKDKANTERAWQKIKALVPDEFIPFTNEDEINGMRCFIVSVPGAVAPIRVADVEGYDVPEVDPRYHLPDWGSDSTARFYDFDTALLAAMEGVSRRSSEARREEMARREKVDSAIVDYTERGGFLNLAIAALYTLRELTRQLRALNDSRGNYD